MAIVISGGTTVVSKGMILDSPEIIKSGYVLVQNSGTVSNAIIRDGGRETVTSGGLDLYASVVSGGALLVQSGGLASRYYVTSSGYIAAYGGRLSGGSAFGGQVIAQGVVVSSAVTKGYVSGLRILSNGEAVFNSNGVGSSIVVDSGNIFVSRGGYVETTSLGGDTLTSKGAKLNVLSGGSAHITYIRSNGIIAVSSGGTATANRIYDGGSALVATGGLLSGTTGYGGVIYISGGSAVSTTVTKYTSGSACGMWLSSGAVVASTSIDSGGSLIIGNGCTALGSSFLKDGVVSVGSGARAFTFFVSGGEFRVSAGGIASGINLGGGYMRLMAPSSGTVDFASADWISIYGSGSCYVSQNGLLTSAFAEGGGTIYVLSGGSANYADVSSGGVMYTYDGGCATNVGIKTGGQMIVLSNGWVSGGDIYGTVTVGGSVTALNVQLLGTMNVTGVASKCTIFSGGRVNVSSGGKLTSAYAQTGGIFTVQAGGTATISSGSGISAWVGGGNMFVSSAQVRRVVVYDGGAFVAREGSYISGGNISAGTLALSSGCSAGNVSAFGDGSGSALAQLTVMTGAKASNGDINGVDGRLKVNSGGSAFNMIIQSAGTAMISGIIESSTVRSGGYLCIVTGDGLASRTYVGEGGYMELNSGTGAVVTSIGSGGQFYVQSGAVANTVHVRNGGQFLVKSGGTAFSAHISQGGIATINSGTSLGTAHVSSGGLLNINGGEANSVTVSAGGNLIVASGAGRMVDVMAGGNLTIMSGYVYACSVSSGASALAVGGAFWGTVSSGGQVVLSGGSAAEMTVNNGGKAKIAKSFALGADEWIKVGAGGTIDFDISNQTEGGTALLGEFQHVSGEYALYSLTVGDTQAKGDYLLATNAATFNKQITVRNTAGEALGWLNVGQITTIGGVEYALNVGADDVLSVTVGAAVYSGTAKSDVNGNGISDVMFVWSGNDYAHGYWLDGTNEWRSTGSNHPAEWENLGCYDMTGDGYADSVLVGNVEVEGVKGAYIGYYADAIDAIDGSTWVNIDYLNNEANVAWVNKIGNLTGGSANSIVWYAPELYTLGAWTDGTSNWVTITGNFGGDDWTLVGCGDFDGDGADSVVMSGANGAYFYAADLDGTVTSLGAANWSNWEVRAIGDFKGDGKDDMVLFHQETGSMVMLANGNLDDFTSIGQLDAADWFVVGAGDYNADAKDDLLVRQYSTGMLGYYSGGDVATGWVELGRGVGMEWTVIA